MTHQQHQYRGRSGGDRDSEMGDDSEETESSAGGGGSAGGRGGGVHQSANLQSQTSAGAGTSGGGSGGGNGAPPANFTGKPKGSRTLR